MQNSHRAITIVHQRTVSGNGDGTMPEAPELKQFRIEQPGNGVLHLVFDMPGRSMNVFSNAAIEELGKFADWLPKSDIKGVVIRSGKPSAFCGGAVSRTRSRRIRSLFQAEPGVAQARDRRQAGRCGDRRTGIGGWYGVCAGSALQGHHRSAAKHVWLA